MKFTTVLLILTMLYSCNAMDHAHDAERDIRKIGCALQVEEVCRA